MRSLTICNLNPYLFKNFPEFSISNYKFIKNGTIPEVSELRSLSYSKNIIKTHKVFISGKDQKSIIFPVMHLNRERNLIEDILWIISLLTGRNVVLYKLRSKEEYPVISSNYLKCLQHSSADLEKLFPTIFNNLYAKNLQQKYDNWFHLRMLYNHSNILVEEPRFLAMVCIWEYIYYCHNDHHRGGNKNYEQIKHTPLIDKIYHLTKKYKLGNMKIKIEKLNIFTDLRNELNHNGRLPIKDPKSRFRNITNEDWSDYINIFTYLTQILVFKTLGVDLISSLEHQRFNEILKQGFLTRHTKRIIQ